MAVNISSGLYTLPTKINMESSQSPSSKKLNHQHDVIVGVHNLPSANTISGDEIMNFENLRENLTEKLKLENWMVLTTAHQHLYIFNLNKKSNGKLSIRNSICIDDNLIVKVFNEINDDTLFNLKLYRWPQLQILIEQLSNNVKLEEDLHFECVLEKEQNAEIKEDYRNDQQEDGVGVAFEFCTTTYDVHEASTKPLDTTVTMNDQKDWFLKVKSPIEESELLNSAKPLSTFHQDGPYICSECGKQFDQNAKLMLHKRVHQAQICPICNESFTGKISGHMQKHFTLPSYQCHICGLNYKNKYYLKDHMQLKHVGDGEFFCDICKDGKNYKLKTLLKCHMKRRHTDVVTKMEQPSVEHCQIEYVQATQERLRKRYFNLPDGEKDASNTKISAIDSDAEESLKKCTTCGKGFPTQRKLSDHKRRHDESKWKKCPICNKTCYSSLSRHINNIHYKLKNYVCEICGCAYSQASTLKEHIAMKHSTSEEFFCDICKNGRVYRSRYSLKKHLAVHATATLEKSSAVANIKPSNRKKLPFYECKLCNEKFPSRYILKSHTTLKHNDGNENAAPQYQCKICDKKFGMKSSLAVHEKIHTGKTHICHQCGQSFSHPNYLRKHLNRHKGGKNKECTMCDKRYAQNVDLRLHMKKVHGVTVKPIRKMVRDL